MTHEHLTKNTIESPVEPSFNSLPGKIPNSNTQTELTFHRMLVKLQMFQFRFILPSSPFLLRMFQTISSDKRHVYILTVYSIWKMFRYCLNVIPNPFTANLMFKIFPVNPSSRFYISLNNQSLKTLAKLHPRFLS